MRAAANWGQWLFVGIVVTWLAFAWLRGGSPERRGALTALVASGLALGFNQVLGFLWDRPRPFVAHPATVHLLVAHARDGSFPSDHAAAGFAIAFALYLVHHRLGSLALLAATVMSYARVYVGLHYPSDVLVGALIGVGVTWALTRWALQPLSWIQTRLDRLAGTLHLPSPKAE